MIRFVGFYRRSEEDADSAIDDPPVERRPRVNGPSTIGMALGTHERVVARLTNISQVLGVGEESDSLEALLHQRPDDELSGALRPIGTGLRTALGKEAIEQHSQEFYTRHLSRLRSGDEAGSATGQ